MHLTIPPSSIRPLPAEVHEALSRLRLEAELTEDTKSKALLLHEIGYIEEVAGDDHAAARDLLAAVNTDTQLREPLEQLCFLLERRGSLKNLARLLERLVRVATTDQEKARAHEASGDFAVDANADFEAARVAYEAARALGAPGVDVDLSLQLVAGETDDLHLMAQCLERRAEAAVDETYRAALWVCLARLQLEKNQPAEAQASLERAVALETPVRAQALLELERLARLCADRALLQRALERQAELWDSASRDQSLRRRHGIDALELSAAKRADAWLRASQAYDQANERSKAVALALKARALLPADPCLLHWLLERADQFDDTTRRDFLTEELGAATDPDTIAALALAIARERARGPDVEGALQVLDRALEHEPESVVARALELELSLRQTASEGRLGRTLERLADASTDSEAVGRACLQAAVVHAELGSEGRERVQALLTKALASGFEPDLVLRLSRSYAIRFEDHKWYQEATQRVLKSAGDAERPGLLLDLVRTGWSMGDETAALFNLEEASTSAVGGMTAALLTAFAQSGQAPDRAERSERGLRALTRIAQLTRDPDRAFALRTLVLSLRARSPRREAALRELEELHRERPADPVVAFTLLGMLPPDSPARVNVLEGCAAATPDAEIAFALRLEAAVSSFRAGDRERAIRTLKLAHGANPDAVGPLLSWALRSAHPDDPEERRLMLAAMRQSPRDARLYAVERFGLEAGSVTRRVEATAALDEAPQSADGDLDQALALAAALWPSAKAHAEGLRFLATAGDAGREIARALAFLAERRSDTPSQENLERLSGEWAESSLAGALEWLSAAVCGGNVEHELLARERIARDLAEGAATRLRAGSLLIAWLTDKPTPLLATDHTAALLANLEVAPPGSDPRKRAQALLGAAPVLSAESELDAIILAGYNHLFAGAYREALATFHEALSLAPDDLSAWEGIRAVARRLHNVKLEADALHKLSELTKVPGRAAELERERSELLAASGDDEASQRALERAVELDIEHFDSFNRLFRRFRGEKRYDKVLALADRRLAVTNDPKEVAKLCWERARAHRGLGNMEAALSDLDTVRVLDPTHPGPAALAGEIFVTQGDLERAAEELANLSRMETAPDDQRQMAGLAAADLYDGKLDRTADAVSVLELLHESGLGTLGASERLAKGYAKLAEWEKSVSVLDRLMVERPDHEGRVEAARLAMAICRDELHTPSRALSACERLLANAPDDAEALDYILEGELDSDAAREFLRRGREVMLEAPTPRFDASRTVRLARIAQRLDDRELRLASGGLLLCSELRNSELRDELDGLLKDLPLAPRAPFEPSMLRELFAGAIDTPIGELCRAISPYLMDVLAPNPRSLGLGRRDRLKPQTAPELFALVQPWFAAAGVQEVEAYVGGAPHELLLFPGEKHATVVFGSALKAPMDRAFHADLAQKAAALASGLSFAVGRESHEVAAVVSAACGLGEVELPGRAAEPPELRKMLGRELPRRVKKQLPELAERVRSSGLEVSAWCERVERGFDRARALVLVDVSLLLLSEEQRARGETVLGHFLDKQERRLDELSRLVTSSAFSRLRRRLGLQAS